MDVLFYDGQCSLCRREIRLLRQRQRGSLEFVDIHQAPELLEGRSSRSMLMYLHLKTSSGEWFTGLDATARAWSHTRWGWLFSPLGWPLVKGVARRIYSRWAERRYQRLYGCSPCLGAEE